MSEDFLTVSDLVNPVYAQSYCWIMEFGKTSLGWTQFEDFNKIKRESFNDSLNYFGSGSGTRTRTNLAVLWILSPVWLPITPYRRSVFKYYITLFFL